MGSPDKLDTEFLLERVRLADSYLDRMYRFKTQLLIWGCSLNYLSGTYIVKGSRNDKERGFVVIVAIAINYLIAEMYQNEHIKSNRIINLEGIKDYLNFSDNTKSSPGQNYKLLIASFCIAETFWFTLFWGIIGCLINRY